MFCFPLVVFPGYRQINKVILAVIVLQLSLSLSLTQSRSAGCVQAGSKEAPLTSYEPMTTMQPSRGVAAEEDADKTTL